MELTVTLERPDQRLELFGPGDKHLRLIRDSLNVQIFARDGVVKITGASRNVSRAAAVLQELQRMQRTQGRLTDEDVIDAVSHAAEESRELSAEIIDVLTGSAMIKAKTPGQKRYIDAMRTHDMIFCLGPAGTGKTYLAVAMAVHLLKHRKMKRLILVRPAVEAGEKLGFLPGDLQAKVNPYLRPLFDALHDMMDFEQVKRFMVNDVIEVIPLAYMRGRTLNDSVIILDEAQNTTPSQMLMFLTRMGHGSKVIVTGDASQVDLPDGATSGLEDAQRRLRGIKGIATVALERGDIVRHRLVQNVVDAYERTGGPATTRALAGPPMENPRVLETPEPEERPEDQDEAKTEGTA